MISIRYRVRLTLDAPFHYGGGKGVDGSTSYLSVDHNGKPYWPGSAFKGKVRHYATQFIDSCTFESARQFDMNRAEPCGCPVCRMLGNGGNSPGSLVFGDLSPASSSTLSFRAGNAVDRARRVVDDDYLFHTETADVADALEGTLTGFVQDENELALLMAAVQSISFIGGDSARGLGWLKQPIELIQIQDTMPLSGVTEIVGGDITMAYTLTLTSPAIVGGHSTRSNHRVTQRHIPGSVVRAALAKEIVQQSRCDTAGKINYVTTDGGNGLYPTMRAAFTNLNIGACMPYGTRFAPITAVSCKYDHKDILFDSLIPHLSGQGNQMRCPVCGGRMERYKNLCSADGFAIPSPDVMTAGKSAIARHRGVAQDELLYTIEMLTPGTKFEGRLSGEFSAREFKELVGQGLRVGGKLTSGCGHAIVSGIHPVEPPSIGEMKQRIHRFNNLLPKSQTGILIPVTLLSDAIVDLTASDGDFLGAYQTLFPDEMQLILTRVQQGIWRGFDTSKHHGYLNPIRQIIHAGAVFVLSADSLTDAIVNSLYAMERQGIGERTLDGFGHVVIADDFHAKFTYTGQRRERAEQMMPNASQDRNKKYVTLLIKELEDFIRVKKNCSAFRSGGNGKRQFSTLVEASQKACCLDELCLFIQYKKSKTGTERIWKELADPLAEVLRGRVKEIGESEGVDPLNAARQFLGYLMWQACVLIENNQLRGGAGNVQQAAQPHRDQRHT